MKTIALHCQYCEGIFHKAINKYNYSVKKGQKIFCSRKCALSHMTESNKTSESVQCNCDYCGKSFERNKADIKTDKTFCSISCSNKSRNTRKSNKEIKLCAICSKTSRSELCKICYQNSLKENYSKCKIKDKPRSCRDQYIRYHSRKKASQLGWTKCCKCGYDKHVEVAHIKPVCEFDEDTLLSEVNSESNLIPLCPNCHWEFDNLSRG